MQTGDQLIPSSSANTGNSASGGGAFDERRTALLKWGATQNYPQHWFLEHLAIAAGAHYWRIFAHSATDEKVEQALQATQAGFSLPAQNRHDMLGRVYKQRVVGRGKPAEWSEENACFNGRSTREREHSVCITPPLVGSRRGNNRQSCPHDPCHFSSVPGTMGDRRSALVHAVHQGIHAH